MLALESSRSMVTLDNTFVDNDDSSYNFQSTIAQLDEDHLASTKALHKSVLDVAQWMVNHVNAIQENPRQMQIMQRQLQRVYKYKQDITEVENQRKSRRTNKAGNDLTVLFQPPSI
jgi:hypothetical protein